MLVDRSNWAAHKPWFVVVLLMTASATIWYVIAGIGHSARPSGSSLPGITFGIAGGILILFEFLFWTRKYIRVWRIGSARFWMRAHIWLGLLSLPVLILHSGLRLGGTLSTTLMILLVVVVLSGIWGLLLQQYLPSRLLADVPAETVPSQIDVVLQRMRDESTALIAELCGPEDSAAPAKKPPTKPLEGAASLRAFHRNVVVPYFGSMGSSDSPLRSTSRASALFVELRERVDPLAHHALETIEEFVCQRRQFELQARVQYWLHNWLCVHAPLSVALVVLMIVHAVFAFKFW